VATDLGIGGVDSRRAKPVKYFMVEDAMAVLEQAVFVC
jgi:hypothetical protein